MIHHLVSHSEEQLAAYKKPKNQRSTEEQAIAKKLDNALRQAHRRMITEAWNKSKVKRSFYVVISMCVIVTA